MKKLDTSSIATGVAYPPSKKGIDFLYLSNQEMLNVLAQTFGGELVANAAYVLYGCQKTDLGSGNFSFAKGAIYDSKTGEIFLLDAVASIAIATAPVMAITITYSGTYNPVKFSDASSKNVHQERKLVISDGALNSKDINYADLIFAQQVRTKIIDIGVWDMDATAAIQLNHGISDYTKIRSIDSVTIRTDGASITPGGFLAGAVVFPLGIDGTIGGYDSTKIQLQRAAGGMFDSTSFNDTSINRGWVVIRYVQ